MSTRYYCESCLWEGEIPVTTDASSGRELRWAPRACPHCGQAVCEVIVLKSFIPKRALRYPVAQLPADQRPEACQSPFHDLLYAELSDPEDTDDDRQLWAPYCVYHLPNGAWLAVCTHCFMADLRFGEMERQERSTRN
jgi:hypothetical protein